MNRQQLIGLAIASTTILSGTACVSSRSAQKRQSKRPQEMIAKKEDPTGNRTSVAPAPNVPQTSDQAADFIARHSNTRLILNADDTAFLELLQAKGDLSPVEEAALTVGSLKALLYRERGGFGEEELDGADRETGNLSSNQGSQGTPQVERLATSLIRNPLLGSHEIGRLVFAVIKSQPADSQLAARLTSVLRQHVEAWQSIGSEVATLARDAAPPTNDEEPHEYQPLNTGDLRMADAVLMEAQSLADQKQYAQAIKKINNIGRSNPLYEEAQVKIRSFANGAVQELRRKAALAYQSALPVADPQAKAAYLIEAKKYLEEAIEEFPAADQLEIVQENLDIIQKDLARLDVGGTEDDSVSVE